MIKPLICAIAAMDETRVIGNGDKLPNWNIPEDLAGVKKITKGAPLIMGRSTFESIHGYRKSDPQSGPAWPNRLNVVISRNGGYFNGANPDNVMLATSPKDGLNLAYDFAANAGIEKIFIFGGAEIYTQLLPETERLYLTEVEGKFEGDAFFPELKSDEWVRISHNPQDNGAHKFAFNIYDRKP